MPSLPSDATRREPADAGEAHPFTQAFFSDFVTNLHHGTTVPGETNKSCCKATHSLIEALEFPVSACHPPFHGTVKMWSPSTAPGSSLTAYIRATDGPRSDPHPTTRTEERAARATHTRTRKTRETRNIQTTRTAPTMRRMPPPHPAPRRRGHLRGAAHGAARRTARTTRSA